MWQRDRWVTVGLTCWKEAEESGVTDSGGAAGIPAGAGRRQSLAYSQGERVLVLNCLLMASDPHLGGGAIPGSGQ